mmetsp:Transcript_32079/g.78138  ORF Transcript_32079/g.78138 Transcript_32079/m.78138 type:complete len:161 (-) Transcript_32079:316-798(-)
MSRKIDKKALIPPRVILKGQFEIEIGPGTVLHPECQVNAQKGPIKIGAHCLLEEQSIIVNMSSKPMVIGDYNYVEVGSKLKALRIGSRNRFEPKSSVALGAEIGDDCIIGAKVSICGGDKVGNKTIVFSNGNSQERRKLASTRNLTEIKSMLEQLSKILF